MNSLRNFLQPRGGWPVLAHGLMKLFRSPTEADRRIKKRKTLGPCCAITPFEERVEHIRSLVDAEHINVFDAVMARVDQAQLAELQDVYRDSFDPAIPFDNDTQGIKYLDIAYWTAEKLQRDYGQDLFEDRPRRILDIGCGAAHVGAVYEELGHEYVGIDISYPIGDKVAAILGLDRRIVWIEPQTPLPETLGRFDMVTALGSKFHHIGAESNGAHICWTLSDWDYFLRDVTRNRMNYPGSLHLQINGRKEASARNLSHRNLANRFKAVGARTSLAGRTEIWLDIDGEQGLI